MKKKQMKKLTAVVAPVLAMSMALTACSTSGGDKKTSTNSSGDSKSEGKLAAKQVLNRTVNQEIPTMDSSKSTDTVSSQMLGIRWKDYIVLIKIISLFQPQQNLARKVKMVKIYI